MSDQTGSGQETNPYRPPETSAYEFSAEVLQDAWGTPKMTEMLRQTRPWVRFLSILGFLMGGLMLVGGCIGGVLTLFAASGAGPFESAVMLIYIPLALIYLVPSYFLHGYANHISAFLAYRRVEQLESALAAQKSFWRFVGIAAALILVFYALVLAGAAIYGLLRN